MLYYSENVTGSIGRVNLELGETGDLIMKGVGEVQGRSNMGLVATKLVFGISEKSEFQTSLLSYTD